jgi:hypothetical protein
MKSLVHRDCRTPKYKMQVVASRKGKGSFKRGKRVEICFWNTSED